MITKIPQESVRRLGSAQVITDSIAVIKELLENSLDAGARSVIIESSRDLLSFIQVKDDGAGITPIDRPLMAKPHCTNKITTFDDIVDINTLGFRGEFLASLAALSGQLTITTRVRDETVGAMCDIAKDGSIRKMGPVSTPVGCIVRIDNLFSNFPVRKTSLAKTAQKLLLMIRPLLLSYSLTHPRTRFQFKHGCGPRSDSESRQNDSRFDVILPASSTVEQAVINALGSDLAKAGEWINSNDFHCDETEARIHVKAFVIRCNSEASLLSKKGVYIAYKSRPLSLAHSQGLAKHIYGAYKQHIKAFCSSRHLEAPRDPFLFLNIFEVDGKVDINIEPAKDDVLIEDHDILLNRIRELFANAYPYQEQTGIPLVGNRLNVRSSTKEQADDLEVPKPGNSTRAQDLGPPLSRSHDHEWTVNQTNRSKSRSINDTQNYSSTDVCPLDQSPSFPVQHSNLPRDALGHHLASPPRSSAASDNNQVPVAKLPAIQDSNLPTWSFSMYRSGVDSDDESFFDAEDTPEECNQDKASSEADHLDSQSIETSNPWTLSKMTAPIVRNRENTIGVPTSNVITPFKSRYAHIDASPTHVSSSPVRDLVDTHRMMRNSVQKQGEVGLSMPKTPVSSPRVDNIPRAREPWYPSFKNRESPRSTYTASSEVFTPQSTRTAGQRVPGEGLSRTIPHVYPVTPNSGVTSLDSWVKSKNITAHPPSSENSHSPAPSESTSSRVLSVRVPFPSMDKMLQFSENDCFGSEERYVTAMPHLDQRYLLIGARTVVEDLYSINPELDRPRLLPTEAEELFKDFISRSLDGLTISHDIELDTLRQNLMKGTNLNWTFQNLEDLGVF